MISLCSFREEERFSDSKESRIFNGIREDIWV